MSCSRPSQQEHSDEGRVLSTAALTYVDPVGENCDKFKPICCLPLKGSILFSAEINTNIVSVALREKEIEEEHFKMFFLCVTNIQHDN